MTNAAQDLARNARSASNLNAQRIGAWLSRKTEALHDPVTRTLIGALLQLHGRNAITHERTFPMPGRGNAYVHEYACATCTKDDTTWRLTSDWEVADRVVWPCQTVREIIRFLERQGPVEDRDFSLSDVAAEAIRTGATGAKS